MTATPADLDALLAAAAASAESDGAAIRRFTDALLASTVGCLLSIGADGRPSPLIAPARGTPSLLFFSTPDKAQDARQRLGRPELRDGPVACRELFTRAVRSNTQTALNPFSPYGKAFTVPEMSDLLAGVEPGTQTRTLTANTTVRVGEPAHIAPGLVEGLTVHLRGLEAVDSASLAWVEYPDGLQGYLLVIRTALPRETVLAGIEEPASRTDGRTIDILVVAPGDPDAAASVPPFYSRT